MDHQMIIRIILTAMYFALWFIIVKRKGRTIWESFKGDDHILQVSEFVALVGTIAYVFMIPADAFWQIEASEKVWYGVDAIIMFALGVSGFLKANNKKKDIP